MIVYKNKEFRNLQEQVLKNAQDIEILKEKPNLSISIVDELPETGEEGILYLVPSSDPELENAYDEYVWLPESESFEMVGSTSIDLSNMVTTDTDQTITGEKSFVSDVNLQSDINVGGDVVVDGMVVVGASGYDIKKDGSNMVIEADGNPVKVRGAVVPNSTNTYGLGSDSLRWNKIYVEASGLDFGSNAWIQKDGSNRITLCNSGDAKLKVGASEIICKGNFSPDQDSQYGLGRDNLRWAQLNVGRVQNKYSSFFIEANGDVNVKCSNTGGLVPSSNNLFSLGKSGQVWSTVYANDIDCPTIVKKPDYANPNVWASGTLGSGTGEDTIDLSIVGTPDEGLYMFTYGNAQCFIALTSTMIQNAASFPMRCPCPVLKESGGSIEGATGNLKISRSSDILTIKVASTISGSATSTNGWGWQLIKVM